MEYLLLNSSTTGVWLSFAFLVVLVAGYLYNSREQKKEAQDALILQGAMDANSAYADRKGISEFLRKKFFNTFKVHPAEYTVPAFCSLEEFLVQLGAFGQLSFSAITSQLYDYNHNELFFDDGTAIPKSMNPITSGTSTLGLEVLKNGVSIMLILDVQFYPAENFIPGNFTALDHYQHIEFEKPSVPIIRNITVLSDLNQDTQLKKSRISELLKATRVSVKKGKDKTNPNEFHIYKSVKRRDEVYLTPYAVPTVRTHYELDTMYNPVKVNYNGKDHALAMSKMVHVVVSILKVGGNVLFHGDHGTGKSQLLRYIMSNMRNFRRRGEKITYILVITPNDVTQLERLLDEYDSESRRLLVIIDEADPLLEQGEKTKEMSTLSQIMAGPLKDRYNVSFLLATNLKPEEIHETMAAPHRIHQMVEFGPIDERSAKELATIIKATEDGGDFDQKAFEKLAKESLTVGKIFACLKPKEIGQAIKGVLEEYIAEETPAEVEEEEEENTEEENTEATSDQEVADSVAARYKENPESNNDFMQLMGY